MSLLDDSAVMDQVREGRLERMALLFERHHRKAFGFLLRLTGDRQVAEDLAQEVFLQMLRGRETWKSGSAFLPWMFQIARNLHVSHLRRQRPEVASEVILDLTVDPQELPSAGLMRDQDASRLRQALATLPPRKRELLLLSREEDLSYRDLAGMLSISLGTVKVQVHRALQDLRQAYLKLQGGTT